MPKHASVAAVVLAAGEGKRLKSDLPKVLHVVSGRPLLAHVVGQVRKAEIGSCVVVASKKRDEIERAMTGQGLDGLAYVVQDPPSGTADAVRIGIEGLEVSSVVVLAGDTPLITADTLKALLNHHSETGAAATVLTALEPDPTGYGRIVRNADGSLHAIVEHRDASDDQLAINEINAGIYVFDLERLRAVLPKIGTDNSQTEYYITDAIGLLVAEGDVVQAVVAEASETHGVNSRADLAEAGALFRKRVAEYWMAEGVSIVDPSTTYIDASVEIQKDATILPFTFLEGATRVLAGAEVGPHARIVDSEIGEGAVVSYAVVRGSTVGPEASVGPFASLRPGTTMGRGARLGTFVESKSSTLGDESKANHLAYLGDAEIGSGVNVGAGTITCNWDGQEKHKTVIEDDAYIGSDTMLVAPLHIGKRAATGAGSVVRQDVPEDGLAVGVPAKIIEGKGDKMKRKSDTDEPDAGR